MLEVKYYLIHVLISILWVFSLHKHSINVPRLIWSSVVMIESEKSWKHVSICEFESYNYKFTVWLKQEKVKRPRKKVYGIYTCDCRCMNLKLFPVFQRNYNAVLWRQTRCPTQMLARARHSCPLKFPECICKKFKRYNFFSFWN